MLERESAVAGHVVRVRVRLEHTLEPHPFPLGRFEILLDREGRIDHDCLAGGVVADQVGGTAKIVVDELAKKHETEPNKRSLRTPGRRLFLSHTSEPQGSSWHVAGTCSRERGV